MPDALFDLPSTGVLSGARLSDCGTYRYSLDRVWDAGLPTALYIMLNPSTADASEDDPTIRRCIAFAKREGCGSLTVVNLFALRATNPDALPVHADPIGPENDTHILLALSKEPGVIIAAWGANPYAMTRARQIAGLLARRGDQAQCLGVTRSGAPRHPLYVVASMPLSPWSVSR